MCGGAPQQAVPRDERHTTADLDLDDLAGHWVETCQRRRVAGVPVRAVRKDSVDMHVRVDLDRELRDDLARALVDLVRESTRGDHPQVLTHRRITAEIGDRVTVDHRRRLLDPIHVVRTSVRDHPDVAVDPDGGRGSAPDGDGRVDGIDFGVDRDERPGVVGNRPHAVVGGRQAECLPAADRDGRLHLERHFHRRLSRRGRGRGRGRSRRLATVRATGESDRAHRQPTYESHRDDHSGACGGYSASVRWSPHSASPSENARCAMK